MLTEEEIGQIRVACDALPLDRSLGLALAAAHRTLPVYQAYSEVRGGLEGHGAVHDVLVGAWRVLRGRPGASMGELAPRLDAAINRAESDARLINEREGFGLPEALATESINSAVFALRAFRDGSRGGAFDAMMGSLEIDLVWAEGRADLLGEEAVSWGELRRHFHLQVRDIAELSDGRESDEKRVLRDLAMRADREGLSFLVRMREFLSGPGSDSSSDAWP